MITPMNPIEVLVEEHNLLRLFLAAYEKHLEESLETGRLSVFTSKVFLNDIKVYIDSAHMLKEERHLAPRLFASGVSSDYGPLVLLEDDHNRVKLELLHLIELFETLKEGSSLLKLKYVHTALYTITLLRLQMLKEEKCIYPLALRHFTPSDLDDMQKAFHREDKHFERERIVFREERIVNIGDCFGLMLQDGRVIRKSQLRAPAVGNL